MGISTAFSLKQQQQQNPQTKNGGTMFGGHQKNKFCSSHFCFCISLFTSKLLPVCAEYVLFTRDPELILSLYFHPLSNNKGGIY